MVTANNLLSTRKKPAFERVFFYRYLVAKTVFLPVLLLCGFLLAEQLHAEVAESRLEFGLGFVSQTLNGYRGSRRSEVNTLPFPFFTYRGDVFKVDDRDGARGEFFVNEKYELNISADVALRSGSDENRLREGMPELKTAFQLGPELNLNLSGKNLQQGWMLRLPARGVFAFEKGGPRNIGYTFNPKFTYKHRDIYRNWNLKADLGVLFGSQKFHDYYYSVPLDFSNSQRGEYRAAAGFSGYFSKLGLHRRKGNWLYKVSIRYDNLSDVSFLESPLIETRHYFSVSAGLGYVFHRRN